MGHRLVVPEGGARVFFPRGAVFAANNRFAQSRRFSIAGACRLALLGQFTAPQSNGIALILRTDVSVAAPCARTKLAPNRTGPSACPKVGFDNACAETTAFVDWREDLPGPLFMIKTVK